MIKLSSALLAIVVNMVSVAAMAAARCDELTTDGDIWNLICAADDNVNAGVKLTPLVGVKLTPV